MATQYVKILSASRQRDLNELIDEMNKQVYSIVDVKIVEDPKVGITYKAVAVHYEILPNRSL